MIRHSIARMLLSALFTGAVVLTPLAVVAAQDPEEVTVAGCIQAGPTEGQFLLSADDEQTYQIQAAEHVAVAAHVNHRVQLTGVVEKSEERAVFKASKLEMVAASCEA